MKAITLAVLLTLMPQQVRNGTVSVIARDAITQQGVSGVFVNLTYKFPREPAGASTSLLTDQQGRATFNLPPGNYQMAAERQGYAITKPLQDVFIDPGQSQSLEISFNPLAAIAGRVLNANGDPLTRIDVSATSMEYQLGQNALVSRARAATDDRGEFRVFGLQSGEYYLKVDNSSRVGRSSGDTPRIVFHPGVLNLSEAKSISIRGQSVNVGDIRIPVSRVFSISGTVADEATGWNERNRPSVYLTPSDVNNLEESIAVPTGQSTTLNSREIPFTIQGIKPGDYFLYAVAQPLDRSPVFMEKTAITIRDRDITGLSIAVKPPVELRTRMLVLDDKSAIAMDGIGPSLQRRDRRPISTMNLFSPAPLDPLTGESVFTLGNNSSVSIRVYGLYGDSYVADIRQGGKSVFKDTVIEANQSANLVEIDIRTKGGTIQGTVRDTSNQLSQATVVLVPDLELRKNLDLYKRTLANVNGEFTLRGIAPGRYQIFALPKTPEGPIDEPAFIFQYEGRMTTIATSQGTTTQTSLRVLR